METVSAPFDPQQVEALNWFQRGEVFVPYTCESTDEAHLALHAQQACMEKKPEVHPLEADTFGLTCPVCNTLRRDTVPAALLAWAIARKDRAPLPPPLSAKRKPRGKG